MREKVQKLMRHSDPRMLLHHPVLAMQHVIDGFKKPEKIKNSKVFSRVAHDLAPVYNRFLAKNIKAK
jgi:hypothetical protein